MAPEAPSKCTLAPCASSSATTSCASKKHAALSAVCPSKETAFAFAPALSSILAKAVVNAAKSGVELLESRASTPAPAAISAAPVSRSPTNAAMCKGVVATEPSFRQSKVRLNSESDLIVRAFMGAPCAMSHAAVCLRPAKMAAISTPPSRDRLSSRMSLRIVFASVSANAVPSSACMAASRRVNFPSSPVSFSVSADEHALCCCSDDAEDDEDDMEDAADSAVVRDKRGYPARLCLRKRDGCATEAAEVEDIESIFVLGGARRFLFSATFSLPRHKIRQPKNLIWKRAGVRSMD